MNFKRDAIDVHHHILPPDYVKMVGPDQIKPLSAAGRFPDWSPQMSIDAMDRNGVELAVTSMSAPGFIFDDVDLRRKLVRHCNLYAAQMRSDHPERFGLFASLPLPDVEGSLEEIDYCFDILQADGICLLSNYSSFYPGDERFGAVFDELNRRNAVVYFHPTTTACCSCFGQIPAATLEFPFDTTRAICSLLFSGTFHRCRDIRFIFSHAGGALPFLTERIMRLERFAEYRSAVPDGSLAELSRLYFDIALSANRYAFSSLLELVKPSQVLFGSDYPFASEAAMTGTMKALGELGLSAETVQAIRRDNALRLLPSLTRPRQE